MNLELPKRTLESITDQELEACIDGSTNLTLVKRLLKENQAPDGWVWAMDFGDAFAREIEGFISAESDTDEWQQAWEVNAEWGEAIADAVNDLLGEQHE